MDNSAGADLSAELGELGNWSPLGRLKSLTPIAGLQKAPREVPAPFWELEPCSTLRNQQPGTICFTVIFVSAISSKTMGGCKIPGRDVCFPFMTAEGDCCTVVMQPICGLLVALGSVGTWCLQQGGKVLRWKFCTSSRGG